MSRFISMYGAISDDGNSSNNNKITTSSAAMTTETEKKTWDPSRPLFPTEGKKRILSELSANEEDHGKRLVEKSKYAVEEKDGEDDDGNNDDGSDDVEGDLRRDINDEETDSVTESESRGGGGGILVS